MPAVSLTLSNIKDRLQGLNIQALFLLGRINDGNRYICL
ncbi:hypothetical protein KPK_5402 [Klebsiella variicola]|uniref:Uncharacterized protein n=1 Tax=Klebsiella variicola (strain 342) TaxID=507522 RepID=B5XYZ3_KLEV3|nr:hypothetical protein KPK_5402 [Klebsiella variicola]